MCSRRYAALNAGRKCRRRLRAKVLRFHWTRSRLRLLLRYRVASTLEGKRSDRRRDLVIDRGGRWRPSDRPQRASGGHIGKLEIGGCPTLECRVGEWRGTSQSSRCISSAEASPADSRGRGRLAERQSVRASDGNPPPDTPRIRPIGVCGAAGLPPDAMPSGAQPRDTHCLRLKPRRMGAWSHPLARPPPPRSGSIG